MNDELQSVHDVLHRVDEAVAHLSLTRAVFDEVNADWQAITGHDYDSIVQKHDLPGTRNIRINAATQAWRHIARKVYGPHLPWVRSELDELVIENRFNPLSEIVATFQEQIEEKGPARLVLAHAIRSFRRLGSSRRSELHDDRLKIRHANLAETDYLDEWTARVKYYQNEQLWGLEVVAHLLAGTSKGTVEPEDAVMHASDLAGGLANVIEQNGFQLSTRQPTYMTHILGIAVYKNGNVDVWLRDEDHAKAVYEVLTAEDTSKERAEKILEAIR